MSIIDGDPHSHSYPQPPPWSKIITGALALWKVADLVAWMVDHLSIGWK